MAASDEAELVRMINTHGISMIDLVRSGIQGTGPGSVYLL